MRRKHQLPEPAEHYRNRVEDWFENDNDEEMETYQDLHFIKKYCEHIAIPFEHYQTLLHGEPSAELLACELFQDYKKDFDQSNDIKKLATQKFFKDYSTEQKQTELKKRFLAYLQKIEKDKLLYFVLAYNNPQKVLIVKSPSDNKEQKQFLGYEWSAAKGNEGIKLTTDAHGKHLTPLYDPENRYNPDKINALIQENFSGNAVAIPESLQAYVSLVSLVDLLDFSRKDFDKHISLSAKKAVEIETKWDVIKLGEACLKITDGSHNPPVGVTEGLPMLSARNIENGKIMFSNGRFISEQDFITEDKRTQIQASDVLLTIVGTIGRVAIVPIATERFTLQRSVAVLKADTSKIIPFYLVCALETSAVRSQLFEQAHGVAQKGIYLNDLKNIKIPIPPSREIQTQIVQACEAIDAEVEKAELSISKANAEIKNIVSSLSSYPMEKIDSICSNWDSKRKPVTRSDRTEGEYPYYGASGVVDLN